MSRSSALSVLLLLAAVGCESAAEPTGPELQPQLARSAAAPVHRVTAGGQVDYSAVGLDGYREVYGITASVDGDGNVRGQFESHWGVGPDAFSFHMDLTCMSVSGNTAWLGGVTTQSNSPYFPVGTPWVFRVVDGGEGADAADAISYFYAIPADECANQYPIALLPWTQGNVQVR